MSLNELKLSPKWAKNFSEDRQFIPLGYLAQLRNEKNDPIQLSQVLSLTADRGVLLYEDKGDIGNRASEDVSRYSIVRKGDLVINSMNVIIGSVGLSKYEGVLSPVYYVLHARDNTQLDMRYLAYHFSIHSFQSSLKRIGYGILDHRMRIPWVNLKAELICMVSIQKQRIIADYLDNKTAAIDKILELRTRQIDDLDEVSKSLTQVGFKDVESVDFIKAKYLFEERNLNTVDAPLASATMHGVVLRSDSEGSVWNPAESTDAYKLVEPNDFVINLRSFQHGFSFSEIRGKVSPAYSVFRLRKNWESDGLIKYFSHYFQSRQFIDLLATIAVGIRQGKNIPFNSFADLLIPVPKREILGKIHSELLRNSIAIEKVEKSIQPFLELRNSLITQVIASGIPHEKEVT